MSRREAIRAMMLAGAGLAAGSSLAAAPLRAAGVLPQNWKFTEPAKGDQVIHRTWKSLGNESISLLGMGCMRFPRKAGGGRRAPLCADADPFGRAHRLRHGPPRVGLRERGLSHD